MCKDTITVKDNLIKPPVIGKGAPLDTDKLWLVHGEYYDLADFVKRHPGGEKALATAKGQDCTTLFEQYHVMSDKHLRTLAKYRVGGEQPVKKLPQEDPFHLDIKNMVREYARTRSIRMSPSCLAVTCVCAAVMLYAYYLYFTFNPWSLVLLPVFSWLVTCNTSHDGAHFATTSYPWLNSILARTSLPLFYNPTFWYIQHNVSHHGHTNDPEMDLDLMHGLPFVKMHQKQTTLINSVFSTIFNSTFMYAVACRYLTVVYPVAMMFNLPHIMPFSPAQLTYFKENFWVMAAEVFAVVAFTIYPFFYLPVVWAVVFSFVPSIVASLIFMVITQVSHIQVDVQPGEFKDQHWSRTMVETTCDYSQDSAFWSYVTGGLNMQALHHIIPGVSSSHYRVLYPSFRAICKKHGVKIIERRNLWAAFLSLGKTILDFSLEDRRNALAAKAATVVKA